MSENQVNSTEENINNFVELNEAFKNCTKETKEHIKKDLKNFADLVPQIPGITAAAINRGLKKQVDRINEEFGEIDTQSIANSLELGAQAGLKAKENEYWESQNPKKSKVITSKVTDVKNKSLDKRAKRVDKAVKITSGIAKGLALFGQKGLAKRMQDVVTEKGTNYIMKDSRAGKILENVTDFGYTVAFGAKWTGETIVEGAKIVRDNVENGIETVVEKAVQYGKDVKEGLENVEVQNDLNYMNLAREAIDKNQEVEQWQNAHEDRNSGVTGAVKGITKASTGFKAFFAQGKIKVSSLAAKGVALSGKKGLAEEIAAKGFNTDKNMVKKESRIAKFAQRMAESGFIKADKFRAGVDHTKEMAGAYARAGVQTAKETVHNVKDAIDTGVTAAYTYTTDGIDAVKDVIDTGIVSAYTHVTDGIDNVKDVIETGKVAAYTYATDGIKAAKNGVLDFGRAAKKETLEFGKATYKGAATAVAIASIPLEAVAAGAVWSADKVAKGAKYTGSKILDGAEIAGEKISEAKTKISENKTKASKGIKSMMRSFASSIVEKLGNSIEKDDEKLKQFGEPEKAANTKTIEDVGMEIG